MNEIKTRLQELKDLQAKAHEEYLEAKKRVAEKQQDSFSLIWQIEQAKEKLMTAKQSLVYIDKKNKKNCRGFMTINVSTHYNKHIKSLDQNNFIYKVKKAFYLLTSQEERLYEVGFSEGFLYAANVLQKEKIQDSNVKKIVGYKITKPKPSDVQSIINKVCIHFEVHKETLMNKSRTSDIVRARNVIHNLLYEKYHMNLTDIGKYFGQDHTTVLHSIEMKRQQKRFWSPEQSLWQEFEKLIS